MTEDACAAAGILARVPYGKSRFSRDVRSGRLTRLLPGVAAYSDQAPLLHVRALAVMRRDPDAVIIGEAAAALTWWKELDRDGLVIEAASRRKHGRTAGYRFRQTPIPPELIMQTQGFQVATPELTVIQLAPTLGGKAIDEALRRRVATLESLTTVLREVSCRRGNKVFRKLLWESRDEPWSEPERLAHQLLHEAGIRNWRANQAVALPGNRSAFPDIAFDELKLDLEVDGPPHHCSVPAHEHDCRRDVALTALGWQVVRFTASMVEHGDFIERVRDLLRLRCRTLGVDPRRFLPS